MSTFKRSLFQKSFGEISSLKHQSRSLKSPFHIDYFKELGITKVLFVKAKLAKIKTKPKLSTPKKSFF